MHHYLKNTAIVVLLLAIGGGGAYYYHQSNSNQASQQTTRQASQGQSHAKRQNSHHSNWHNIPVHHKTTTGKMKQSQPVNKPGYTLSVLPKDIQGTWYSYNEGKLETLTISNDKITDDYGSTTIHARPKNTNSMKASKHPKWSIALTPSAIRGQHFTQIMGWNQSAGDGESYAIINVNGMTILDSAGGADYWTDANFYRTPQQAKQNKKKIYKNKGEKGY